MPTSVCSEFIRFHKLPEQLTHKIRNYVEFAFSVTKGINVDSIAEQLPKHLQLEMHLHLNRKMVEQVRIFAGCPRAFIRALVVKLQPNICVTGDYVVCSGEKGNRMYFIRRGVAEVMIAERVINTLREGDYFGEIALLSNQRRSADVRAVTDCMLLTLSLADFEAVLEVCKRSSPPL
jgi:CRP-like cAMP-binding protein